MDDQNIAYSTLVYRWFDRPCLGYNVIWTLVTKARIVWQSGPTFVAKTATIG